MNANQRNERKQEIINILIFRGYSLSPRGNDKFQKVNSDGKLIRYDVSGISVRKEIQVSHAASQYCPASKSWKAIWAGYIKDVEIDKVNDQIVIPKREKRLA
jgi:hypothetical protein